MGEAHHAVTQLLDLAEIKTQPVVAEAGAIAVSAFDCFGKGRHPAALNFGDCFTYAGARLAWMPLLYKGDEFSLTDIETMVRAAPVNRTMERRPVACSR